MQQKKSNRNILKTMVALAIAFVLVGIPTNMAYGASGTNEGVQFLPFDDTADIPAVEVDPYVPVELLNDSFEDGLGNWVSSGGWVINTTIAHTGDNSTQHPDGSGPNTLCNITNATGYTHLSMTFWAYNGDFNDLNITVTADGTIVGYINISDRGTWHFFTVNLDAYAGGLVTICFNYNDPGVYSYDATVLIDDVIIIADNRPAGIDIVVDGLPNINCGGRNNTVPREIWADVSNWGLTDAPNVSFHLQIYQEVPIDLVTWQLWDFEQCILLTWEAFDNDGDGMTWYWTEERSNSPTHSYHSHPDNLPAYEAYSNDSLILKEWYHINSTVDGDDVEIAYLTFAHFAEGEFIGGYPLDYGMVYIINSTGTYEVGGPYYDTDGAWEELFGDDGIDISDFIGDDIKIEFRWISDATGNYEGWYIDDVNIDYSYTARQPLIFQGYKYVSLNATETKTIKFPIDWEPPAPGTYYIQVYAADRYLTDVNITNNDYNCTVWFGDVCDPAVTDIIVPDDVILEHSIGYVEIPINVTVENNGTLDLENVPIKVSAAHSIVETLFSDDVESGDPGYVTGGFGSEDNIWHIEEDFDFFSPYNAWAFMDGDNHYGAGQDDYLGPPLADIDWLAVESDPSFDITAQMKWRMAPTDSIMVYCQAAGYIISLSSSAHDDRGYPDEQGWTTMSITEWIGNYLSNPVRAPNGCLGELGRWLTEEAYGGTYPDDFGGYGWIVMGDDYGANTDGLSTGTWSGVLVDDVKAEYSYTGATVWEDTILVDIDVGETKLVNFTWNATEYCDFIITAEVDMDCEGNDPNNDMVSAPTRIHEWQYIDDYEDVSFDDNTCGGDTDWRIDDECSICPDNSFWYNGEVENYSIDRNDCLEIDEIFNFSGRSVTFAYLNFSTYFYMETGYDYGYVEVSNDSGTTWFILETLNNNSGGGFVDYVIALEPLVTMLSSPYTGVDFLLPATFFTEDMHFRFRFFSDGGENWKGWYLDDVSIDEFNGTWNQTFFDDMEADDSADNWLLYYICYGNHWHEEDMYNTPYPMPPTAWWNGDNRSWIGVGTLYFANYEAGGGDGFWGAEWGAEGSGSWNYWFGVNGERLWLPLAAGPHDAWLNMTIDLSLASGAVTVETWLDYRGTAQTYWFTVTNGTFTKNFPIVFTVGPGHYYGGNESFTFDVSEFAGQDDVVMGYHVNFTADGTEGLAQWYLYVNSSGPTIPYNGYYNNVDEKLIFEYDLTHAYEAIMYFDQNYSFADEGDTGYVEVWTGSEWKTLFIVKGSGYWGNVELDISDYVGGDEMTMIRFRFVSNDNGTDMGWFVDSVSIDGKVDYTAPTASHSVSPSSPNGNNGWYTSDVTVTITADDNVQVGAIKYRIDGGSWLTYTSPFTIGIEGEHTVEYYPVDGVGNEGAHGMISFKIDKNNPTASITTPQAGYIYFMGNELMPRILVQDKSIIIGPLIATATGSDSMSGIFVLKFNEDGTTFAEDTSSPFQAPLPFALFQEHTLTVTAVDMAGNSYTTAGVTYLKIF